MLVAIDEFVWPPLNIFTLRTRDTGKLKESTAINVFLFAFHQLVFLQFIFFVILIKSNDMRKYLEYVFCTFYFINSKFSCIEYFQSENSSTEHVRNTINNIVGIDLRSMYSHLEFVREFFPTWKIPAVSKMTSN